MLNVSQRWLVKTQSSDVVQRLHSLTEVHLLSIRLLLIVTIDFRHIRLLVTARCYLALSHFLTTLRNFCYKVVETTFLHVMAILDFFLPFAFHWVVLLSNH